jgi:hypothetical protein
VRGGVRLGEQQPGRSRRRSGGPRRGARDAVASYDPEREAVVMESRYEAVNVILVRETEVVTLGSLVFVTPT